jgi:hypothetical protein
MKMDRKACVFLVFGLAIGLAGGLLVEKATQKPVPAMPLQAERVPQKSNPATSFVLLTKASDLPQTPYVTWGSFGYEDPSQFRPVAATTPRHTSDGKSKYFPVKPSLDLIDSRDIPPVDLSDLK